jgi:hypothetical protein
MEFTTADRIKFKSVLACVLFKGYNPQGEPAYAYVAMHLDEYEKILTKIGETGGFNPKDFNATVLARFPGDPSEEVQKFMRRKFGFSDDQVIVQREKAQKPAGESDEGEEVSEQADDAAEA